MFVGIGATVVCLAVLASCGDEHDEPSAGFAFVDRGRLVVVDAVPDEWGDGEPYFDPDEPAVGRAANLATIPPQLAPRDGAHVILMDRSGPVCESRAGALSLTAIGEDADGHEGSWGPSGYWDYLAPRLVADLGVGSRCAGATWAVVDQPAPEVVASVPADAEVHRAALARLRATREYASLYEGLREMAGNRGGDEALPLEEESVVRVGGVVAASIRVPLGWHYEPTADLFALTALDGSPLGEPTPFFVTSLSVFDLEGDGRDEILAESGDGERMLLRAPGAQYGVTASFSAATVFHGMP